MKICLISDTHEKHNEITIPPCDILIHAGDFTNLGEERHHDSFVKWFKEQPAKHRILIGGNHDLHLHNTPPSPYKVEKFILDKKEFKINNIIYLEDELVEIEGLKIYGSPWTPKFGDWAFMKPRETINYHWDKIPEKVDFLITHGPPYGILDQPWGNQEHVGCKALLDRIMKVKPKAVVFGHIHGGFGFDIFNDIGFYNVSVVGEDYKVRDDAMMPIILEWQ